MSSWLSIVRLVPFVRGFVQLPFTILLCPYRENRLLPAMPALHTGTACLSGSGVPGAKWPGRIAFRTMSFRPSVRDAVGIDPAFPVARVMCREDCIGLSKFSAFGTGLGVMIGV